ncbi:MAG: late competence development ComFB family protein [Candidatus Riflebacteria bacterium]|nr:late competence development ComFB family protein [Candidatus Riflebacteria bacterium]
MALANMENLQEERVFKLIRELLQTDEFAHVCRCADCFVDIAAISLNHLPPEYVADKFYKFPENPETVDSKRQAAIAAIRTAIDKVTRHPHHE